MNSLLYIWITNEMAGSANVLKIYLCTMDKFEFCKLPNNLLVIICFTYSHNVDNNGFNYYLMISHHTISVNLRILIDIEDFQLIDCNLIQS